MVDSPNEAMTGRLDDLPDRVEALDQTVVRLSISIDSRFDDVSEAIAEQRRYTEFAFETLRGEMRAGFAAIDQRFAAVDLRFAIVDERFAAIDLRFAAVDVRFDALERRFDGLEQRFDALEQRFDALEQRFGALEQRFDRFDEKLDLLIAGRRKRKR